MDTDNQPATKGDVRALKADIEALIRRAVGPFLLAASFLVQKMEPSPGALRRSKSRSRR